MSFAKSYIDKLGARLDLDAPAPRLHIGVVKTPITPFVSRTGLRDHVFASCAMFESGVGFGHVLHMQRDAADAATQAARDLLSASPNLGAMLDVETTEAAGESSVASKAAACM